MIIACLITLISSYIIANEAIWLFVYLENAKVKRINPLFHHRVYSIEFICPLSISFGFLFAKVFQFNKIVHNTLKPSLCHRMTHSWQHNESMVFHEFFEQDINNQWNVSDVVKLADSSMIFLWLLLRESFIIEEMRKTEQYIKWTNHGHTNWSHSETFCHEEVQKFENRIDGLQLIDYTSQKNEGSWWDDLRWIVRWTTRKIEYWKMSQLTSFPCLFDCNKEIRVI
jgi:hypothetical protein